jgi:hypothetical protein
MSAPHKQMPALNPHYGFANADIPGNLSSILLDQTMLMCVALHVDNTDGLKHPRSMGPQ